MFGYATELRTITSGRGTFDMRFECYEPVPAELAEDIVRRKRSSGD
jgi:elongation factor G